jgi:hypothetical protein
LHNGADVTTRPFYLVILPVKSILSDGIPQAFLPFRFVDIIVITVHDRF